METPVLFFNPGYTLAATHCLPFTKTSTTLLSIKILRESFSPGLMVTGADSGARDITSGRTEEYDVSREIML
jgi:hypothetical protein